MERYGYQFDPETTKAIEAFLDVERQRAHLELAVAKLNQATDMLRDFKQWRLYALITQASLLKNQRGLGIGWPSQADVNTVLEMAARNDNAE